LWYEQTTFHTTVNELLPIRTTVRFVHDRWSLVSGKPLHWNFAEHVGDVCLSIGIRGFKSRGAKERVVEIPLNDLPATHKTRFDAKRLRELKRLLVLPLQGDEEREITLLECTPASRVTLGPECDLRDLRQQFFDLAEDTEDLLKFLNRFGAWNYRKEYGYWRREHLDADSEDRRSFPKFIELPDHFWSFRSYLKRRIEKASDDLSTWFNGLVEPPRLEQIPTYPYHAISLSYVEEGLITSLSLELLREVRLALCARPDCRKPFSITRAGKLFCSEKCARCMVTRRGRAKKRIEQSKG
jgi:hypothetical protein